jgi:hypothetical protein
MVMRHLASVLILAVAASGADGIQDRTEVKEHDLKAAFVYNFLVFAEWPESAFKNSEAPIVVGILGKDPFDGALEKAFKDRTAHGRKIEIRQLDAARGATACQLVFIPDGEKKNLADVLAAAKDRNVLVVCESGGLAAKGAALNLVVEDKKVKIEANPAAASRAGVKLSAKLLKLARIVQDDK